MLFSQTIPVPLEPVERWIEGPRTNGESRGSVRITQPALLDKMRKTVIESIRLRVRKPAWTGGEQARHSQRGRRDKGSFAFDFRNHETRITFLEEVAHGMESE
jgi:hypothetical protein